MDPENNNMNNIPNRGEDSGGEAGPIIGSIIIIVIIVIGGLYFWGRAIDKGIDENMTAEEIRAQEDKKKTELQTQSNSDDINSIEVDLNNSDFNNLDEELQKIEAELNI